VRSRSSPADRAAPGREHARRLGRGGDSVVVVYLRNRRGAETGAAFGAADLLVHAATAGGSLLDREAAARGVAVVAP
jgi:hypothetical protein